MKSTIEKHNHDIWRYCVQVDAGKFGNNPKEFQNSLEEAFENLGISSCDNMSLLICASDSGNYFFLVWFKYKLQATKFFMCFC